MKYIDIDIDIDIDIYTHNGILLGRKKNELLPFAVATWLDLENIILCEISQRKKNII